MSTLGSELRIVRNRLAHNDDLTTLDAWRANDFVVRLLQHLGDTQGISQAKALCDVAFAALATEKGVAAHLPATPQLDASNNLASEGRNGEVIRPDAAVLTRPGTLSTPTIGPGRFEFEPWTVVPAGETTVLDELPRKVAKEQVRAVATEIAEFEGPVHIDRLTRLTAASFGVRRLSSSREKKLIYQIRQTGLHIDGHKFAWPSDSSPAIWTEFRPNDSTVDRSFTDISPVEIANAMRFWKNSPEGLRDAALDAATLQTFGRKRKTKQVSAHLVKARSLLQDDST